MEDYFAIAWYGILIVNTIPFIAFLFTLPVEVPIHPMVSIAAFQLFGSLPIAMLWGETAHNGFILRISEPSSSNFSKEAPVPQLPPLGLFTSSILVYTKHFI